MDGVDFCCMSPCHPSLPNPPLLRTKQRQQACAYVCQVCMTGRVGWADSSGRRGADRFMGVQAVCVWGGRGGLGMVVSWGGGQTERAGAGAKGGKVAMFSGSCEQKSPAIVHSPLYLPRPSLPPVGLLWGRSDENVVCVCVCPRSPLFRSPFLPLPKTLFPSSSPPNPHSAQL